jgi:tetratricopeptide (TPR) repeat protein
VSRISAGGKLSPSEEAAVLAELEANECWQPLLRHLDGRIARGGDGLDQSYILAIRIRLQYFKDTTAAQALASDLIRRCGLTFRQFRERLLSDDVIQSAGPEVEASLIEAAVGAFDLVGEKVAALERLATVFEKRLFHDQNLFLVFERLTQLDPDNLKALRYFKMVFSQNNEWQQVARILRRMIEVVPGRHEKYRLAHDLACALVYHLNQPRDALVILERYCRESPLDVSQVEYDAAFRTGDLKRCIQVLHTAQRSVRDDAGRAVIQLRMAELHRRTGDFQSMERCLEESIEAWPVFLDPFEPLIQLHLNSGRWDKVIQLLNNLAQRVQDKELVAQIRETVRRVESGLNDRESTHKKNR